jgi:hypothetical protein
MKPLATEPLVAGLRRALRDAGSPWAGAAIEPLTDKGLAHHHLRIIGSGLLARLPKQSQMGLDAAGNLAYEAACYARAAPGGHAPRVHGLLPLSAALPRGGLLVDEVQGRPARLPGDLPAVVRALAAMHALPLPPSAARAPLLDAGDPLAALRDEIEAQAAHLDAAALRPATRRAIDDARRHLAERCAQPARPERRLIAFDGHPGNFLVRADGEAVLVDLEKARYGYPPLDLAHATLYTSTTWDVQTRAVLAVADVRAAYETWQQACPGGAAQRAWFVPLREAMWLWSMTWCAKWRVLSPRAARSADTGEDWSSEHSSGALVAHVRERVDHYLGGEAVDFVRDEFDVLERLLRD